MIAAKPHWIKSGSKSNKAPKVSYGVFIWNENGFYSKDLAIKIFKSEKLAEKYADELNETDSRFVVRSIH